MSKTRVKETVEFRGPVLINLATIDDDMRPASEMRVGLSVEAVKEYAHILSELPPVKLMWDAKEEKHWVTDGAHTLTASAGVGQQIIQAMVADGDYLTAFEAAAHENDKRGVKIFPADRKIRVERACQNLPILVTDWPWSAKRLALFCGVSQDMAKETLDEVLGNMGIDPNQPRMGRDGKLRMPTVSRNGQHQNSDVEIAAHPHFDPASAAKLKYSEVSIQPAAKPKPSPYEGFRKVLDEIQILIGSINAADDDDQQGWGGFASMLARCTPRERTHVRNYVRTLVESLQEWQREMGDLNDEGQGDEA